MSYSTAQIAAATLRLKAARQRSKLNKQAQQIAELEEAKKIVANDPANLAAQAILDKKIKDVMRYIEQNFARCHPVPDIILPSIPSAPRPTSTMMRGFVEAAATGLITDQLQPDPNHPHVAERIRKARSECPLPMSEDEENTDDDSTQPGHDSSDSSV